MSFTEYLGALDANPSRIVILSELLAATDPATLATAYHALVNHNQFTDAEKALVNELNKFKGEHATGVALEAAHPAAAAQTDAWAFVEATDTVWVIDTDGGNSWKDTDVAQAPATIDNAFNVGSTNALSNQVISAAMANRHVAQVFPLPGDGALLSFNVTHTLTSVASMVVRKRANKEQIGLKAVESSATVVAVGPFAVAPADSTLFELVLTGPVAL